MGQFDESKAQQFEERILLSMERHLLHLVEQRERRIEDQKFLEEREERIALGRQRKHQDQEALKQERQARAMEMQRRRQNTAALQSREKQLLNQQEIQKMERAEEKQRFLEERRQFSLEKQREQSEAKALKMRRIRSDLDRSMQNRRNEIFDRMQAFEERLDALGNQRKKEQEERELESLEREQNRKARIRACNQKSLRRKKEIEDGLAEKQARYVRLKERQAAFSQKMKELNESTFEKRLLVHQAIAQSEKSGDAQALRRTLRQLINSHADSPFTATAPSWKSTPVSASSPALDKRARSQQSSPSFEPPKNPMLSSTWSARSTPSLSSPRRPSPSPESMRPPAGMSQHAANFWGLLGKDQEASGCAADDLDV